jgi:hypothetical protein
MQSEEAARDREVAVDVRAAFRDRDRLGCRFDRVIYDAPQNCRSRGRGAEDEVGAEIAGRSISGMTLPDRRHVD